MIDSELMWQQELNKELKEKLMLCESKLLLIERENEKLKKLNTGLVNQLEILR